jgi:predicted TIM-barrel fold metal-dependent hydrolase
MTQEFFDCDMGVGRTGFRYPIAASPSELLAIMDRYRIARALVYDRGAHESGLFTDFDFILEFCKRNPRLLPSIPVLPPATGEQPSPKELVDVIRRSGIRAVRACPNAHNFLFDVFSMGPLLEELEKLRIPVIHSSMNLQDHPWKHEPAWRNIREVALTFPKLPIVVVYTGMLQGRRLLPLLAGCPNVLADLTCVSFQFVESVVERMGSGRLVLASHYPCDDPGLYTTWINYCGVDDSARRAIAFDNLERLMEPTR